MACKLSVASSYVPPTSLGVVASDLINAWKNPMTVFTPVPVNAPSRASTVVALR